MMHCCCKHASASYENTQRLFAASKLFTFKAAHKKSNVFNFSHFAVIVEQLSYNVTAFSALTLLVC